MGKELGISKQKSSKKGPTLIAVCPPEVLELSTNREDLPLMRCLTHPSHSTPDGHSEQASPNLFFPF